MNFLEHGGKLNEAACIKSIAVETMTEISNTYLTAMIARATFTLISLNVFNLPSIYYIYYYVIYIVYMLRCLGSVL